MKSAAGAHLKRTPFIQTHREIYFPGRLLFFFFCPKKSILKNTSMCGNFELSKLSLCKEDSIFLEYVLTQAEQKKMTELNHSLLLYF